MSNPFDFQNANFIPDAPNDYVEVGNCENITIGSGEKTVIEPISGQADNKTFYPRATTQDEIACLFQNGKKLQNN